MAAKYVQKVVEVKTSIAGYSVNFHSEGAPWLDIDNEEDYDASERVMIKADSFVKLRDILNELIKELDLPEEVA